MRLKHSAPKLKDASCCANYRRCNRPLPAQTEREPSVANGHPPSLNWQALGTARAILRRTRTLTRTCLNRKIPKNCGFSGTWPGVSPWPRDRSTRRRGCAGCFLFKEKRVSSCFEDCSDRGQRRLQEKTQMLNACKANNTSSGNEAGEFSRLTMRASGAHIAV